MLAVLGCLLSDAGKIIKQEMLDKLHEHRILCISQEPPGRFFEYLAINYTAQLSVDTNQPVLYIHTKGAGNRVPWYLFAKLPNRAIVDDMPQGAKPEYWQSTVRKFWYHEYTGDRLQEYLTELDMNRPCVVCPFTGKDKSSTTYKIIVNIH